MVGSGLYQTRPGVGRSKLGSLQDDPWRGGCLYWTAHPRKDSELLQVRVVGSTPGRGAADGWRYVLGCGDLSLEQVRLGDFDLSCSEGQRGSIIECSKSLARRIGFPFPWVCLAAHASRSLCMLLRLPEIFLLLYPSGELLFIPQDPGRECPLCEAKMSRFHALCWSLSFIPLPSPYL